MGKHGGNPIREARKAAGLCSACGIRPLAPGRAKCSVCFLSTERAVVALDIRLHSKRLNTYGWVCACCGESNVRVLELAHPLGVSGTRDRKEVARMVGRKTGSGRGFLAALDTLGWPLDRGYRTLCAWCNQNEEYTHSCPCRVLGDWPRKYPRRKMMSQEVADGVMLSRPWVIPWKTYIRPEPDQTILTPNGPLVIEVCDGPE
jgi:hypothetical protein